MRVREKELLALVEAHGLELRGGCPWKLGDEFLPFHPSASHIPPEYRDGWNYCFVAALGRSGRAQEEGKKG